MFSIYAKNSDAANSADIEDATDAEDAADADERYATTHVREALPDQKCSFFKHCSNPCSTIML